MISCWNAVYAVCKPLLLICSFLLANTAYGIEIRVNVGGSDYMDTAGRLWVADTGYSTTGNDQAVYNNRTVLGTDDQELYRSQRWDGAADPELVYSFAVPNGDYHIKLHLAEVYPGAFNVGARVFDVYIEGQLLIDDVDIYGTVGSDSALIHSISNATVSDGELNIEFVHQIENPTIAAIEIIELGSDTSPPSIPQNLTTIATTSDQIVLNWDSAADSQSGVAGYRVYRDSVEIGITNSLQFADSVTPSRSYLYEVAAYDYAGNQSVAESLVVESLQDIAENKMLYRINVGGEEYLDSSGILWASDMGYNTGRLASDTSYSVAGTNNDRLYQEQRWDRSAAPEMAYRLLMANGQYSVKLHFAEMYAGVFNVGDRIFDVYIEDQLVLDDLDIFASSGARTALVHTLSDILVEDGQLDILFVHQTENPTLAAIEVISENSGQAPTPELIAHWEFETNEQDSSGNELTGDLQGDAVYSPNGKQGSALSVSGNGYFLVEHDPLLDFGTNSFSIAAYFLAEPGAIANVGGRIRYLFGKGTAISDPGIGYAIAGHIEETSSGADHHNLIANLDDNTGRNRSYSRDTTATIFADGQWHHYAMVVDRDQDLLIGYIDGVKYSEFSISDLGSFDSSSDFMIGKAGDNGPPKWYGLIDDFRVYRGALTADDVAVIGDFPTDLKELLIGENDDRGEVIRPDNFVLYQQNIDIEDYPSARLTYDVAAHAHSLSIIPEPDKHFGRTLHSIGDFEVKPNRRYILSAVVDTGFPRAGYEINLGIEYLDSEGNLIYGGPGGGLPALTNENTGGWERWERTIVTHANNEEVVRARLSLGVRMAKDIEHDDLAFQFKIADFALIELPEDEVIPFAQGQGVTFGGGVGDLNMRLLSVVENNESITITTTGVRYAVSKLTNLISMEQRIGTHRVLGQLTLSSDLADLSVSASGCDELRCILSNDEVTIGVQRDGLLGIVPHGSSPLDVELTNFLGGDFNRYNAISGDLISEDDFGGFVINPYIPKGTGKLAQSQVYTLASDFVDLPRADKFAAGKADPGWKAEWTLNTGERLFASVFPMKPYDWKESFEFNWASSFIYHDPSTTLYADTQTENPNSWYVNHWVLWFNETSPGANTYSANYIPRDEQTLLEHISAIHDYGKQALSYFSSQFYYSRDVQEWLGEIERWKDTYGIDGAYLDGLAHDDWLIAYEHMRGLRSLFPDGPIIVHDSFVQNRLASAEFRPFLHTYATLTYLIEATVANPDCDPKDSETFELCNDESWLWPRYITSQFRKSNVFGDMKGDGWYPSYHVNMDLINLIYNGRSRRPDLTTSDYNTVYLDTLADLRNEWMIHGEDPDFYDRYYLPLARERSRERTHNLQLTDFEFNIGRSAMPIAGEALVTSNSRQITLSLASEAAGSIRYTLDGTEPTEQSALYTGPLSLLDGSILRAKTFNASLEPSKEYFYHVGYQPAYLHYGFDQPGGMDIYDEAAGTRDGWYMEQNDQVDFSDQLVPGQWGQALSFDGVEQRISVEGSLDIGSNSFTVMSWVYVDNPQQSGIIELRPASGSIGRVRFGLSGSGRLNYGIYDGAQWYSKSDIGPVLTGQWHHLAVSFHRDGVAKAYIDGVLVDGTLDISGASDIDVGTKAWIGYDGWTSAKYFSGQLDEIKIFKGVLSVDAIQDEIALSP